MTWFETLTGCRESGSAAVRKQLIVSGEQLRSLANGRSWRCGTLATPALSELRQLAQTNRGIATRTTLKELVADVQDLHCDPANAGAMFQVASQFNLLEMISPGVTPEAGVGLYEADPTQGPACAIACGA